MYRDFRPFYFFEVSLLEHTDSGATDFLEADFGAGLVTMEADFGAGLVDMEGTL